MQYSAEMSATENKVTLSNLLGVDDNHVVDVDDELAWGGAVRLHPAVLTPLRALHRLAAMQGFDLRVASGYRGLVRQRAIWNAKASGQRPVFDELERPVDISTIPPARRLQLLLCWSAIPGLSRHHWGTDLDIIDAAAIPADFELQLTVAETRDDGPFARFHAWLDEQLRAGDALGFDRPYDGRRCAVAAEPWHLSYRPLADAFQAQLVVADVKTALVGYDISLWDDIAAALPDLLDRYVRVRWSQVDSVRH